jgi:hypothetical protein
MWSWPLVDVKDELWNREMAPAHTHRSEGKPLRRRAVAKRPTLRTCRPELLTQARTSPEAALPDGWRIVGLMQDDKVEPWSAQAIGQLQPPDFATGKGDGPAEALQRLADELRERRGSRIG